MPRPREASPVRGPAVDRHPGSALPVEDYEALGDGDAAARLYASPLFRRAVAVASPSLSAALDRGDSTLARARARGARLRYAIRMATRPTPFGAFAGVALAEGTAPRCGCAAKTAATNRAGRRVARRPAS